MAITTWVPYPLWDLPGLQHWLNEQAQKGYALLEWPGFSFVGRVTFTQDPAAPQSRYCLDPIGERIGDLELQDRSAHYAQSGWQYVGKIGKLYAIYRCDDPEAPALYNDPESLAWAMKRQLRWAAVSMGLCLLWAVTLFWDEWPLLLRWPEEILMTVLLQAELLIPLYGMMLGLMISVLSDGVSTFRGIRRLRSQLSQGQWPAPGPKRYPEGRRMVRMGVMGIVFLALVLYLMFRGFPRSQTLQSPSEWEFPHVRLEELLESPVRHYSDQELLHIDTLKRSLLAPAQYNVAQGAEVTVDGKGVDTRLYQEHILAKSPAIARLLYRGRLDAHRHSLERYRVNWEENTKILHNDTSAFDYIQEETLEVPGLDGLTRFTYLYSDQETPSAVYIGWRGERVFVLNCSGAISAQDALALLMERLP